MDLTQARLRQLLRYSPETGDFTWAVANSRRAPAGSPAGNIDSGTGYLRIRIDNKLHSAHRLAFLYMIGEWPKHHVDHMDGSRTNNRWENLRDVLPRTNFENQRRAHKSNKTSGLLGVSWCGRKRKWLAHITVQRATKFLGYFATAEDAHARYLTAKRVLHAGCTL